MKNGGLRFARPPYGLSTHVDLKLVSRLEFGSGAVAVRHEPGTVRAGRINRPLCMLRPGSPACAILPGLPGSGGFPGCKRRLPPFRDWSALLPGKGGIQLSAPYDRAWLSIAYYFLTWFFKAWLFVDSKAKTHSAP
jgi:hypothetical protein